MGLIYKKTFGRSIVEAQGYFLKGEAGEGRAKTFRQHLCKNIGVLTYICSYNSDVVYFLLCEMF